MPVLLLDNGGGLVKAAYDFEDHPKVIPNATASIHKSMQTFVADEIEQCQNRSVLHFVRPCERGYVTNWQCEIDIWTRLFNELIQCNPSDTSLILTEPILNIPSIQNELNEIIFEYFGFKEYVRKPSMWFSAYSCLQKNDRENIACTVVDSGFSFTHVAPFVNYRCIRNAIKRVDIGGKLLTNYLKELVSYRQWNMMDEFLLINEIKEQLCYVSNNALRDISTMRKPLSILDYQGKSLKKNFVLPDFIQCFQGYTKPDEDPLNPNEQILTMETERFQVPELLFNPIDIGLDEAGIAEATWQSLRSLNDEITLGLACGSILLTGGNTKFFNFKNRFQCDLRPFVPDMCPIQVYQDEQPELYVWNSMKQYSIDVEHQKWSNEFIEKQFYYEGGSQKCNEHFDKLW